MRARGWLFATSALAAALAACTPEFEPFELDPPDAGRRDLGVADIGGDPPYDGGVIAEERRVGWSTITSGSPAARDRHAMAYSPKDRAVLLFGGVLGMERYSDETLVWDGSAWIDRQPANKPTVRCDMTLAEDKNGNVILFGGATNGGYFSYGETWIWDGVDWRPHTGMERQPERRLFTGMAYDHARERLVLYGGSLTNDDPYGDTWEWTGDAWIERTPVGAPVEQPPRQFGMRMAFDSVRQRVLMVGGVTSKDNSSRLDTIWEWNGDYWERSPITVTPGARAGFAMAYDIARSALVIFSGLERNDSAELVRGRWRPIELGDQPHWVYNTSMAYDRAMGRAVLFGGFWSSTLTGHRHENTTYMLVPLE